MKECQKCKTILEDDELFCHECGTKQEIEEAETKVEAPKGLEGKKCVHCGEVIESDSFFCPFCGANQHEQHAKTETTSEVEMIVEQSKEEPIESEDVQTDEQESAKSPLQEEHEFEEQPIDKEREKKIRTWIWILLVLLIIAGAGWYFFNDVWETTSKVKDTKSSTEMKDNTPVDDEALISKRVTEIYNDVFSYSGENYDSKYCSKGFLALVTDFHEAYEKANTGDLIGPDCDHWTAAQDCDNPSMSIISISKLSDKEATAKIHVKAFKDSDGTDVKLKMIYENGNWFIDDFIIGDYSERDEYQGGIDTLKDLANANKRISEAYIQKLKEHAKGEYMRCEYFLYDITKDGIPELWIISGQIEIELELTTYTHDLKKILQRKGAGYSYFCEGNDYVLQVWGRMGSACWIKLYYDGNKIQEKTVFEEEGVEDYTKPKEKEITITDCNDITPIRNAFK